MAVVSPGDVANEIDAAVAVAPLVVVPAHQLEEAAVQLDAAAGVEDARVRVVDEVGRDDLVVGVGQDALQVRLARLLHRGADLLVARRLHRLARSGPRPTRSASARGTPCR